MEDDEQTEEEQEGEEQEQEQEDSGVLMTISKGCCLRRGPWVNLTTIFEEYPPSFSTMA